MSQTDRYQRDREAEAKLAQKRVENVEKHLGVICDIVGSITRKNARLRDKGDLLARNLVSFAESDQMNPSTHVNLLQFAQNYAAIQDYHHAKVQRMETKVLKPLMKYGEVCRYVKRNIKSEISVCKKENKVALKLEKLHEKSDDRAKVVERELDRVQGEEQLVGEAMDVEVDKFERDKIHDVKVILGDMVKIEMMYHAKALEYLSKCFENVGQINVEDDLDEYRTAMSRLSGSGSRGDTSARSQRSEQKLRVDASTLTSTGSTGHSSDTRASGTFSSSGLSSLSRSRSMNNPSSLQPQFQAQPQMQPSPRRRQSLEPSPRRRQSLEPSPRRRQELQGRAQSQGRQSPQVRISSPMYGDEDDEDDSDDDDY